jgi:hypothetical membrane protein
METMIRSKEPSSVVVPRRGGETGRLHANRLRAGALLTVTGIGIIMSIITNEALYPRGRHYSTFANSISDLGGTLPPNSYMVQPNRTIFIATMAVAGILVLAAAYLLWPVIQRRRIVVGLGAFGVGLIGIAVFPGNVAGWHPLFALVCFIAGSLTAILSRKVLAPPVRYFATALGSVALGATVFGLENFENWGPQAEIGSAASSAGSRIQCCSGSFSSGRSS